MVNKKILFLIFAGIFLIVFSEGVSADWQQKVDWDGNAFEWCDVGTTSHNVEYCGYSYYGSDIYEYACDEDDGFSFNNCVDNTKCFQASAGSSYKIAYIPIPGSPPIWYSAKCKGASHNVGRHFANMFGGTDNDVGDYGYYQPYPKFATITCTDIDGDGVSRSGGACGQVESTACDRDSSTYGIYSPSTEIFDEKDNDCDGVVDEGFCENDQIQSCGTGVGECEVGTQTCTNGQWSTCAGSIGPTTETCDGEDNNCDGLIDANNLDLIMCYRDKDKDRFGMLTVEGSYNSAWFPKDACSSLDYDYCPRVTSNAYWDNYDASYRERWIDDWSSGTGDCDNDNSKIFPNAPEICDSIDNQCSGNTGYGQIDENPNTICQSNPPFASGQICHSGTCGTPRVYWASDSSGATEIITPPNLIAYPPSKTVYLVLEYPPFISGDREWKFEIYEKDYFLNPNDNIRVGEDALTGTITGNKIIATWTIIQADIDKAKPLIGVEDPFDFYFRMYDAEKPGGGGGGGVPPAEIILGLKKSITGKSITGFYTFKSTGPEENKYLKISWIEEGQTQPQPPTCTDGIKNQDETGIDCGGVCPACSGEVCSDNLDCQSGNCIDDICEAPPEEPTCSQTICSDYSSETDCTANSCQLNSQTPTSTCPSDATSCGCSWNGATCGSSFIGTDPITGNTGTCSFQEDSSADPQGCADDGFLKYSTKATWSVTGESGPPSCADSPVSSIICASKTRLPLESKFGILLTIITIIGIYFLFFRGNKKRKNL